MTATESFKVTQCHQFWYWSEAFMQLPIRDCWTRHYNFEETYQILVWMPSTSTTTVETCMFHSTSYHFIKLGQPSRCIEILYSKPLDRSGQLATSAEFTNELFKAKLFNLTLFSKYKVTYQWYDNIWHNCSKLMKLTAYPESSQTLHVLQTKHCHGDLAARRANSSLNSTHDGWTTTVNKECRSPYFDTHTIYKAAD